MMSPPSTYDDRRCHQRVAAADQAQYIDHLEKRLQSVGQHYQQLWDSHEQFEAHVTVVEGERDELRNQLVYAV
jgi:hypothetical protein